MDRIIAFLKSSHWASRILFCFWVYASFFSPYSKSDGILSAVVIYSILAFPAIIIIEVCTRVKKKTPKPKPTSETADKYMSPRRIAGICVLSLSGLFMIIGIYANSNPDTYADNNMLPGFFLFVIGLLLLLLSINDPKTKTELEARKKELAERKEAKRKQQEQALWVQEHMGIHLSVQQIQLLENEIELPQINTPVFLSHGEVAVYYCVATRQETKTRVVGHTGGHSGATIRIAKGLSVRTGSSSSSPVYGDVSTHYDGELVITNKRLVFLNEQKGFEVTYNRITAATAYSDGLSIQSGSHTYTLILPKAELAIIAFNAVRTGELPIACNRNISPDEIIEDPTTESSNPVYIEDELFEAAVDVAMEAGQISVSTLQRQLKLGYARSARIVDEMEKYGIVGPFDGARPRQIIISDDEWEDLRERIVYKKENLVDTAIEKSKSSMGISSIDGMNGHDFEHFCAELLQKNGFINVSVTRGSGDQGVDILAEKGGVKYAIQCKNYSSALSNTPVQEVNAGKQFYNCHVGVVLTNSTFTPGAKALAEATGVLLWDRTELQKMMG